MRIGIDARFLTHPQAGGFKTYSQNLVAALAEIDTENEYILYLDRAPNGSTQLPNCPNFTFRVIPGTMPMVGMLFREQVSLSRQAARDKLDLLHSPSLTAPLQLSCPSVVTIHDMIWYFPERFSIGTPSSGKRKFMEWYFRVVPKLAARRANQIITVSHAAKESIVQYLQIPPERIFVTHEAASPIYGQVNESIKLGALRQKHQLPPDFILAIGSADPRKNLATLIQAYALLPAALRERYHLVIVWTHSFLASDMARQVETLGLNSQVRFLERVSNSDLVLLYNAAALFVFPSRYEGFGLPLLEALACGTPVVAANNSSIPEIVGDAGRLVETEDTGSLAEAMDQILSNPSVSAAMVEKGLIQAAGFSWQKCAQETLAVYRLVYQ